MYSFQLVAALVLRNNPSFQFTWQQLAETFEVTKDAIRNRVNRFKDKYNITDAEAARLGWNREFLRDHTPESEKSLIVGSEYYPGDVFMDEYSGQHYVMIDAYLQVASKNDIGQAYVTSYDDSMLLISDTDSVEVVVSPTTFTPESVEEIEPLKYIITPEVLVVVRDGRPLTIDKTHKNFDKIGFALETERWQEVLDLIDMKNTLTKYSNGRVTVEGGTVLLDGEPISGKIVQRLVSCLFEENIEALEALSNFLDKCDENPDFRVVTRIYDFIAHNDLRLDKEGYVLAYKVVKHDYKDKYTGTMDNSPGELVWMKRNKVNPKDEETCSHGLHVAAKAYIPKYGNPSASPMGDKVVLCRINPKDFVSIPTDYDSMKARVCEYRVLKDVTELFLKDDLDEGIEA